MEGYFEYVAHIFYSDKGEIERGVTYANSFASAVDNIEKYYGDELDELTIQALEPCGVYILDKID